MSLVQSINVLDSYTANLIAAGEVVDRPAGVIKELLENSIDAGAARISVEIKNGGIAFMRVTDDGCGMSRADAELSIRRHATSKIKNPSDLFDIRTFGFRGEALAAISSVSRFRLVTKRREDDFGTELIAEGERVISVNEAGCADGTSITAEDLFFNQPARLKFLKRTATENAAVMACVQRIAISYPEISFKYVCDGIERMHTFGNGSLYDAMYSAFGKELASGLIPAEKKVTSIGVSGLITMPEYARANRSMQMFYINRRLIKSRTMLAALEEAYKSYIKSDRFPSCALFLNMDFDKVDVNVHPAKTEVRFSDERSVYEAVYLTVKDALFAMTNALYTSEYSGNNISGTEKVVENINFSSVSEALPGGKAGQERESGQSADKETDDELYRISIPKAYGRPETPINFKSAEEKSETTPLCTHIVVPSGDSKTESIYSGRQMTSYFENKPGPLPLSSGTAPENNKTVYKYQNLSGTDEDIMVSSSPSGVELFASASKKEPAESSRLPLSENLDDEDVPREGGRIIGVAFNTYISYESGDSIFLIDKHAAHERILYERLKKQVSMHSSGAQQLVAPVIIHLEPREAQALSESLPELAECGFTLEPFGEAEFALRELPAELTGLGEEKIVGVIQKAASDLLIGGKADSARARIADRMLYSMACKAAVKGGIPDSNADYEWIVSEIISNPGIVVCPHGRPVAIKITKKQLEKLFFRT